MKTNNKAMPVKKYILIYSILVVVTILLDQLSKVWMKGLLDGNRVIKILGNWMTFAWTINDGAAFGSMSGNSVVFFICTVLGLPVFGYFWWRARTRHPFGQIGFAFMIGGTIGNAIDRAFLGDGFFNGGVRDFISVKGFAIFNVADCFLVVGIIMICIALLFLDFDGVFVKQPKQAQQPADEQPSTEEVDD
ncbi:MAG: signal peptidase II [Clostridia bacterium]|nr:signal peptidase II [Clostridia bacterium]